MALARALMTEPDLLLLDEPLSALDGPTRKELQQELKHLQHEWKIPFVLVTYSEEEARLVGDWMLVLENGRQIHCDSLRQQAQMDKNQRSEKKGGRVAGQTRATRSAVLEKVGVRESVGMILGHDLTRVVPGSFKGVAFRKGHIVRLEDLPALLAMGKENIFVYHYQEGEVHEDEAARWIARALAGPGIKWGDPKEGKISLTADRPGLLRVYREAVDSANLQGDTVVATLHDAQVVAEGEVIAATRVIPLVVPEAEVAAIEDIAAEKGPAFEVKAFQSLKVGAVVTGNEVFSGRIKDGFVPRLKEKLERYGSGIARLLYLPDGADGIAWAVKDMLDAGMEMVLVCGGMSVDPDDTTPAGIRQSGADVVLQGTPVFPGAMFLLAYHSGIPIMGLPACVLHDPVTVFDLVLPLIFAGEKLAKHDIVSRGVGGLCRQCPTCRYPACSFGK